MIVVDGPKRTPSAVKPLGFYRQLRQGYPHGPDLEAEAASVPMEARTEVARYLRECHEQMGRIEDWIIAGADRADRR